MALASETAVPAATELKPRLLLFSISLISAAALGYEILLMRLFSIIQWHHFAYMMISLALLGYGVSGTFLAFSSHWLQRHVPFAYLTNAVMMALTMVGCFAMAQRVPFNGLELLWDLRQPLYLLMLYLLFFVPFFCVANCIGLLLMFHQEEIGRIYRADLLGAGGGALGVIVLLFLFPAEQCLGVVGAVGLLGAALAAWDRTFHLPTWIAPLLLLLGIASPMLWPDQWVELRSSEFKGLSQTLNIINTEVIQERSSPLGQLTVVKSPTIPFRDAPGMSLQSRVEPPEQLAVFTDGDSMSVITKDVGDRDALAYLTQLPSALPYQLLNRPKVLVLGPGGGSDVLMARYYRARSVDAVELNPQMIELVRDDYGDFSGGLYSADHVRLHIADGRGFVAGSRDRYELIQLSLLESFSAASAGVQALSESYLYTVEAIADYLEHLEPGGFLAITRWLKVPPRDSLKLFATAVMALEQLGVTDPDRRLVMVRSWNNVTLLVKADPFAEVELQAVRDFSDARAFDLAYVPGMTEADANRYNILDEPYLFDGATALLGTERSEFFNRYKFYIEPATDDRPYFSHFFKWRVLPELLSLRDRGGLPLVEWGYLILVVTLVQAAVVSVGLILVPLWARHRTGLPRRRRFHVGFYFFSLGLAFLFIEIAFIQKFILFLSYPLYAVAVVIFAFLIFAGLGSGYSTRLAERCRQMSRSPIAIVVSGIVMLALFYLLLLPTLFHWLLWLPDPAKIAVSILLIAPLAFCMGMPFPLGLSQVGKESAAFIPWAWGVNGCASVISAVLATVLAIHFGFTVVIILAVGLYLLAAAALRVSIAQ